MVLGQLRPGQVEVDLERAGEVLDELEGPALAALHPARPRLDRALADRERRVGDDEVGVHLGARAEALAVGARAERRVEREALRRELAEAEAAGVAGVQLGEEAIVLLVLLGIARPDLLLLVGVRDDERPLALAQRRLDRVGQPGADPLLHDEAIHHELDVVLQLLVEHEPLGRAGRSSRPRARARSRASRGRRSAPGTRPCGSGRAGRAGGCGRSRDTGGSPPRSAAPSACPPAARTRGSAAGPRRRTARAGSRGPR